VINSEHEEEIYNTAIYTVRKSSNLSMSTRQVLGRGFGRGTIVELPSGQSFNTRLISSNANAHANNNRISAGATAHSVVPGMRDNLRPDYTRLSATFGAASTNPNNLASTINSLASSSVSVAASSMYSAGSSALVDMTGNDDDDDDDDDYGGGGKRRAYTTGNDNDDDDGGGKPRANTTRNDGVMHLSQSSTGSDPEVVKVRGRNIHDYTANRNELTPTQRKVAVTLTNHLSRPYNSATINHLASIREEEYDTPQKVEVLRNSIEDDMI